MYQFNIGLMYQFKSSHYSTPWLKSQISESKKEAESELKKEFPEFKLKIIDIKTKVGEDPFKSTIKDFVAGLLTDLDLVIFEFSDNNPNVLIEFGIRLISHKPYLLIKNENSKLSLPSNVSNEYYIAYSVDDDFLCGVIANKISSFAKHKFLQIKNSSMSKISTPYDKNTSIVNKKGLHHEKLAELYVDYREVVDIESEFARNVKRHKINEKFMYTGLEEAVAWRTLCNDPMYLPYQDSVDLLGLFMNKIFSDIYNDKIDRLDFVCLGVGSGKKEKVILDALIKKQEDLNFYPVDISIEMIGLTLIYFVTQLKEYEGKIHLKSILGDFTKLPPISKITGQKQTSLFALLGNTIGNDDEQDILRGIWNMMEHGDYIMIDAQLLPDDIDDDTIQKKLELSYNLPLFTEFVMTPLTRRIGPEMLVDNKKTDIGKVKIETRRNHPRNLGRAFTIYYDLYPSKSFNRRISNVEISFREKFPINLGYSVKYDLKLLCDIIADFGFKIINTYVKQLNEYYGIVLAQKA